MKAGGTSVCVGIAEGVTGVKVSGGAAGPLGPMQPVISTNNTVHAARNLNIRRSRNNMDERENSGSLGQKVIFREVLNISEL